MVGKYKAYPEYKDSGVGWLGNIPKHWEANKTKWYCKVTDGSHHSPDIQLEGYPFISVTDIGENKIDFCNAKKISKSDYYRLVREGCKPSVGDILLTKDGTIGRACLVNVSMPDFVILSSLGLLTPKQQVLNKFLYYYLISGINIDQMNSMIHGSALRRMTINKINELLFICPEISEQQNIANFLDYETSKIDMLIEKQQQLIKLLEEKRQAVISHTVTKGLNPNVSMKDSGVEWLGAIPEHWQTVAIGRLFDRVKRTGYAEKELLSVYRDYGVIPKSSRDDNFNKSSQDLSSYQLVNPNDLVINKMKTWQGSIAISNYEGIVSPAYFIFKPNKKMYSHFITKYIHYLLRTPIYVSQYLARSKGIRVNQWDLDPEEFRKIKLVIPTKNEQLQSIEYIEKYEEKINKLISKAIQQINLLKERRTTLISAAVTGKIDVRDWQAPTVTD